MKDKSCTHRVIFIADMTVKLNCIEFWCCEERNLSFVPFDLKLGGGGGWLRVYRSRKKTKRGSGMGRKEWGGDRVTRFEWGEER